MCLFQQLPSSIYNTQLFIMNMQKGMLKQKGPTQAATRQRYELQQARFIEGEFTYNTHLLLKRICENGQKQPYMYGVPLYKIMLQVVKIMMMNELQTLFLASTLQEMKWKITDPCLNKFINDAGDITPRLPKDEQAKKVQFSLLLIAYIVKIYLNEDNSLIDFKIRDIIKVNFDSMYQIWVQKVSANFKFNPKNMNRIFKQFDVKQKDKHHQIVDYNKLVADFFKQNETSSMPPEQPQNDAQNIRYHDEPQNNYHRQPYRLHTRQSDRGTYPYIPQPRDHNLRNDINDLPMEEQDELQLPASNYRRHSSRLQRINSGIGFTRQESGNQFFAPDTSGRPNILKLSMFRSSSRADESPQR